MLAKIKKNINDKKVVYASFLVGIIIISIIYWLQKVAPFGKNSMLTIDFFHQYGPMLGELYDRLKGGLDLVYSFSMGMGLPFIRNFTNYLSSPFNFIILLFDRENIIMSYSLIIGFKAICAGAAMNYYLSKKFDFNNLLLIPLGIMYAFCAYFTAYYWNIMWLDGLVMLPLVIYGIEKLIDDKKPLFYIISLAIMIIANYFIGFMVCIFSALYFLAYLIIKTDRFDIKKILNKCFIFGGASLLAGGLSAFLILPTFLGLNSISATSDMWPTSQYYAFTFWEYLANHFTGVGSTVLSSGVSNAANISVGVLSVSLFILFIINPKIKLKIKIVYLLLIAFMIASFFYAPLDFIWHAFHVPNDLPYRYSFIYSFIFIVICAYSLINIRKLDFKYILITYILTLGLIGLLYFFHYKNITNQMIFFNILLITFYFVMYALYHYYKDIRKFIPGIFILAIILECTVTINHNWSILQYIDEFYDDYNSTKTALNYVKSNDNNMYRIERTEILTFNDPSWYGYYGQTTFSSMAYENMAILQSNLGLPGNYINSYYYKQTTPIYDLMFNIKYFIGDSLDNKRYTLFYNDESNYVFKNNYNAGLMFAVNNNIKDWIHNTDNPLQIQNDFIEKATGISDIFVPLEPKATNVVYESDELTLVKYTFNKPTDNMYFYANNYDIDYFIVDEILYYLNSEFNYDVVADEVSVYDYIDYNEKYIINTSTEESSYDIYVAYNYYDYDAYLGYMIDNNKYAEAAFNLQNSKIEINSFKEHLIKGYITLNDNQTIYTSIPYDKGWKVTSNGKNIETFKIGDALLGFDLDSGTHSIVLSYSPEGFSEGAIISVSSLIIIFGGIIYKKKFLKN